MPAFIALAYCAALAASDSVMVSRAEYLAVGPAGASYPIRILVSRHFLRMDDGDDHGNFTLLDRRKRRIFNIVHQRRNILVIGHRTIDLPGRDSLRPSTLPVPQAGAPKVAGITPVHNALIVNSRRCRDVVAIPGLMPDVVAAWAEFRAILATEHARVLRVTPADVREICDTALNIAFPGEQLAYGLPLVAWDAAGERRELQDYAESEQVPRQLFVPPEDYPRLAIGSR